MSERIESERIALSSRAGGQDGPELSDWHEIVESLLLRVALTALFGLVGWAGAVVVIGLVTAAARGLVDAPPLAWASENATALALVLTAVGWAWLRFRPADA